MDILNPSRAFLGLAFLAISLISPCRSQSPAVPSDSGMNSPKPTTDKTEHAKSNAISMPSCYYMPSPAYTKEARAAKFEGTVVVEGLVTQDGNITNMRILKSPGLGLDGSVLKTLKTWKCTPVIGPNGKRVPVIVPFQFNFRLGDRN
jgi:TonB family protein